MQLRAGTTGSCGRPGASPHVWLPEPCSSLNIRLQLQLQDKCPPNGTSYQTGTCHTVGCTVVFPCALMTRYCALAFA